MSKNERCPICGEPPVVVCRCIYKDAHCKKGHYWHTCLKHGVVVPYQLPSHIEFLKNTCTCERKVVTIP